MESVVYTRQSQDRQGEGLGVLRQNEDCDQLAALRGLTVVDRFSDNDISASGKKPRPGFEAVLKAVAEGRANVVIAWSLDRLTRNRRDTVRLIEVCQAAGATIALVRGSDMDMATPSGRMVADILASVARNEIEVKSDRQRRAQEQAALAGLRVGGRRPFGYEMDGSTVREDEAEAVKWGYEALLTGISLAAIARNWNGRGLRAQSSDWRGDSVRFVLRNPRYAGLRRYVQTQPDGSRGRGEIVGSAVWDGLVSEATWRAAQAVLEDPSRRHTPRGARALLTGVALCGVCEGPVHAGGTATGHRSYRCKNNYGHFGRRAEPCDEYVAAAVVKRMSRKDAIRLVVAGDSRPDTASLRVEHVAVSGRLDQLAAEFAEGDLTASQLRTATARLKERLAEIEARMAEAGRVSVLAPLIGAADVKKAWDGLGIDRQRAAIGVLFEVKLHPTGRGVREFRPESVGLRPI